MQYKTITLALLQQSPTLYHMLRIQRTLLPTLNRTARALKERHAYWSATLSQEPLEDAPPQMTSAALEIAVQELQDSLPRESPPNGSPPEPTSLDAAMAFLRRHTPPA